MGLLDKLKKNSTIKYSSVLEESAIFNERSEITTPVPAINVVLSGKLDGGFSSGVTMWAGPSKHFKSAFSLLMAKAYMDKYDDSVLLFYDAEFGTPKKYFESFKIDMKRVIHTPVTNVEELKIDIIRQLKEIEKGEHVIIVLDSLGNLASAKEVEDALNEKTVADMSRAKSIKSLFRMITPILTLKDIPMVVINHTYKEIGMFPKDIVGGGTGTMYSSDNVYIIGRQQDKSGTEIVGYNFVINIEKSRHSREKSKILINVSHDNGISKYSGLMDMALESGHVIKPSNGWYSRVTGDNGEVEPKKWRLADTDCKEFWDQILKDKTFYDWVANKYSTSSGSILKNVDDDEDSEYINEIE